MITDEALSEKIQTLEKQKMDHFAIYNQAVGAIAAYAHLQELLKEEDKTDTAE